MFKIFSYKLEILHLFKVKMGRNVSVHGILNRYQLISYIVFYLSCDVINWVPLYTFFYVKASQK